MMLELPPRFGPRPQTYCGTPHHQLDQLPSARIFEQTASRFLAMPGTTQGPSLISVPGARALFLPMCAQCNEAAFFRGREFAHIHPPNDGSFHMILSEPDCVHVVDQGWGELHPLAKTGAIQLTATMIYAAREEHEISLVLEIAAASKRYAEQPPS